MSILAGFDLVVEVSKRTALDLVKANLRFNEVPANPPFEVHFPLPAGAGDGHAIVDDLTLELFGDRGVQLTLAFRDTSATGPILTLSNLDGQIRIRTTLDLVDGGAANTKVLAADFAGADVSVAFSAAAQANLTSALAGTPLTPADAQATLANAITDSLSQAGRQTMAAPVLQVVPGVRGSISRAQFERLELHNIGTEAIGLFGMLLPGTPGGNASQKTSPAITAGHEIAVSVGARAFHELIFCPSLRDQNPGVDLPQPCGVSSGIERDGARVTRLEDSFQDGHIAIDGTAVKSGTCYEATAHFHARVTLSVAGSNVSSDVALDPPEVNVDVPFYCYLLAAALQGLGLVIGGIVALAADSATDSIGGGELVGGAGPAFGTSGGLFGSRFDAVTVAPEGFTLHGTTDIPLPLPEPPGMQLSGRVTTSSSEVLATSYFTVPRGCMAGTYPYVEEARFQTAVFIAVPRLLGQPLEIKWHLEHWVGFWTSGSTPTLTDQAFLAGTGGTVVLSGVKARSPFPLPGGSELTEEVEIGYEVKPTLVRLTNRPADGNYSVTLRAEAVDPHGRTASASTSVTFSGDLVTVGGDYQARVAQCLDHDETQVKLDAKAAHTIHVVPVDQPRPDEIVTMIRTLSAAGTLHAEELLSHAVLAYGLDVQRAVTSPAAASVLHLGG